MVYSSLMAEQQYQYKMTFQKGSRNFNLQNAAGEVMCTLIHEDSRYSSAEIQDTVLELIGRNLRGNKFDIQENGELIGFLECSIWDKKGTFQLVVDEREQYFSLDCNDFWSAKFSCFDQHGTEIFSLKEEGWWQNPGYLVVVSHASDSDLLLQKLLVIGGFGADVITASRRSRD